MPDEFVYGVDIRDLENIMKDPGVMDSVPSSFSDAEAAKRWALIQEDIKRRIAMDKGIQAMLAQQEADRKTSMIFLLISALASGLFIAKYLLKGSTRRPKRKRRR